MDLLKKKKLAKIKIEKVSISFIIWFTKLFIYFKISYHLKIHKSYFFNISKPLRLIFPFGAAACRLWEQTPQEKFCKIILVRIVHVYMSQGNTKVEGKPNELLQDKSSSILWGTKKTTQNMTKWFHSNWRLSVLFSSSVDEEPPPLCFCR